MSGYGIRGLTSAMGALTYWLDSSVGRSFLRRTYFLTGQAGSGKTHLLLDATRRALEAGRPAVFLAGAQFGQGNLWASIADQLGLEPVGRDILLRAMDAAGEAASTSGSRFVIFIDALNETPTSRLLARASAGAASGGRAVSAHRARGVLPGHLRDAGPGRGRRLPLPPAGAPGFAEREVEATQKYFAHYKLAAPRIRS